MATIQDLLEKSRSELLDLSARNRLLSVPVRSKSARIIQVHDELSEEVYRLLVSEKKTFSFLPGRSNKGPGVQGTPIEELSQQLEEDEEEIGYSQPEDDEQLPANGRSKRHVDSRLQTALSPEGLQRRMLDLYRDARTMLEEQGVNILYLALGQLKWVEEDAPDTPRYAPLVLVPVQLSRRSAADKFILNWTEDEIEENLSLRAKLKADFGLELPPFTDEEDFSTGKYFGSVAAAISRMSNWEVIPDAITLGFFSFAKFLMYRDLDAGNWPTPDALLKQPFIAGLLQDGFPGSEPLLSDDVQLDELIPVNRLDHIVDADGSQTLAIEAVRQGRSLVIQGPPGTGKSQSITNIIATAVLEGKRVLFVAEKLAALEVVKRRLEREHLGALCLELHSNKANKRAVIEEIGRTWKLGRPKASDLESLVPKLEQRRNSLNAHVAAMHQKHQPSELSPYNVIGELCLLGTRGAPAAEISFSGAEQWDPQQLRDNRKLLEELTGRIVEIGLPNQHPWRGICRETILSIDMQPWLKGIRSLSEKLGQLQGASAALSMALAQPIPKTLLEATQQRVVAEYVAQAPPLDKQALCSTVWNSGLEGLREALLQGRKYAAAANEVEGKVVETVWEKDFTQSRSHLAAHGKSLFRFLNGDYRRAITEIRGSLSSGELPKAFPDRLKLVDAIISGQQALRKLRGADSIAQAAFGATWRKEKTDWHQIETILDWVSRQNEAGLGASFRQMFGGVNDQEQVSRLLSELATHLSAAQGETTALFKDLAVDCAVAFQVPEFNRIPLDVLRDRCREWLANPEELSRWNGYFIRARSARQAGMGGLIQLLENGTVHTNDGPDCFDRVYFGQLLREMVRQKPQLAQFDGEVHNRQIAEFKQLDSERLALSKYRTLLAHFDRMPTFNTGVGAAGIVKSELERKRGHRTVRRLLKDAGSVVQAIKPVFMMSPLSVAQFLEPGAVEFDLLVIDEASQVQPVDALGAIARSKQMVVVGDSKQLPPTRFFAKLTSSDETMEEEEAQPQVAQAQDIESILGLCRARGLPEKMLRWHYRSRHHSLIAVSNREFYENRLFIVPSPHSVTAGLGLKFNYISDGVFDSGASGTNRIEAKSICRAVIEHARKDPTLTLGVAAFSVRQQQAILDELEMLRRENPDTEEFFSAHPNEPFFVKNLENVQGDERDVIFISVGYGKDVNGYMAMRFGPLSNEGGERRLNVLISRAKRRCEVFSSIMADDIDLARASGRGVASFKAFLSFAQTGQLSIARQSGRDEESPFEEAVRMGVESLGYKVHPQVGIAGFFLDLAVVDDRQEGRYLAGIECDGAAYHSSRSARDRDRLRQAVLEDHGWIIHRVWSTDWFQRPTEQLKKLAAALDRAKASNGRPVTATSVVCSVKAEVQRERPIEREADDEPTMNGLAELSTAYKEARFKVPANLEPHELPGKELAAIIVRIVEQEGPIHEDEVLNRVRGLWDYSRAGSRIQDAVDKAIRATLVTNVCKREDGFLTIPTANVPVRNRESVSSANLRKVEMLPPMEVRAAILILVDAGHGAMQTEIPTAVARMLGFKSTSAQLRSFIEAQVSRLISDGTVIQVKGMLQRSQRTGEQAV